MLTDGCQGSSNLVECRGVVNGLFSKGLHAVVQYYVVNGMNLFRSRLQEPWRSMTVKVR